MMADPSGRIDRAALERIIQRAAELQTAERDIAENLTPDEVLALGREVGIPNRYLRQAMLEEQTRLPDQATTGLWDRLAGPALIGTYRVVRGDPRAVERALLHYMEQHELLAVQRQQPGRISWEPLGGIPAAIRRSTAALGSGTRPFLLSKVDLVSATLTPLESDYCHVALQASVRQLRTRYHGAGRAERVPSRGCTADSPRAGCGLCRGPPVPAGGRAGSPRAGAGAGPPRGRGREAGPSAGRARPRSVG